MKQSLFRNLQENVDKQNTQKLTQTRSDNQQKETGNTRTNDGTNESGPKHKEA